MRPNMAGATGFAAAIRIRFNRFAAARLRVRGHGIPPVTRELARKTSRSTRFFNVHDVHNVHD